MNPPGDALTPTQPVNRCDTCRDSLFRSYCRALKERTSTIVARIDAVMGDEERWDELADLVAELEAAIARVAMEGSSRWGHLKRHMYGRNRYGDDWADIVGSDWPSVRRVLTEGS